MRKKSVAIMDIRSSQITAVVGERGVNNTFIIKSKFSVDYEGYEDGELLDVPSFIHAVSEVVRSTISAYGGVKTFYVGIPGEFLKVVNVEKVVSFHSAKKIIQADCEYLAGMSAPADTDEYQTIKHSCLYFVLSDMRKIINPIGTVSDSLRGKFCFYQCKNSFVKTLMGVFKRFQNVDIVNLIPTIQTEAMYLIEPEKRDEYAVLFDLGYISSTYSVICGNGLAFCESFSIGVGHIAAYLMEQLEIPFKVASYFVSAVNLNAKEKLSVIEEYYYNGKTYRFSTAVLRDLIREGLDALCGAIEECRQSYTGKNLDSKPINITGEGVKMIRGLNEHISNRLVKSVETVAPKVPFYDKPQFSSLLSLLDAALKDLRTASIY